MCTLNDGWRAYFWAHSWCGINQLKDWRIHLRTKSAVHIRVINGMWLTWLNTGIWSERNSTSIWLYNGRRQRTQKRNLQTVLNRINWLRCSRDNDFNLTERNQLNDDSFRNQWVGKYWCEIVYDFWHQYFFCSSVYLPFSPFYLHVIYINCCFPREIIRCDGHCNHKNPFR